MERKPVIALVPLNPASRIVDLNQVVQMASGNIPNMLFFALKLAGKPAVSECVAAVGFGRRNDNR